MGLWVCALGSLCLLASSAHGDHLLPARRVTPLSEAGSETPSRFPRHHVSARNLLRLERPAPFSLPRPTGPVIPSTIRILAIRVEFLPDTTSKTTGTGQFDYRTPEEFERAEGHIIDQAPHDRLYFERHLAAMSTYYQTVSYRQFKTTAYVFPAGLRQAYTLPHQMAYYSPDVDLFDPQRLDRLVEFLHDAFAAADQDPAIRFADYDAYLIFHAGSDLQHDRLRNSPGDLVSGFLRIGDERPAIVVDGGAVSIRETIIIPETTSQDKNIGALNVTLAHEFGHQLGLPDLYNTFNSVTGVGPFDLMDRESGTVDIGEGSTKQIVTGALPVEFSAWSRAFLGWVTPQDVVADSALIPLIAVGLSTTGTKVIKALITPSEYFLIENRQTDLDGDGAAFLHFQDGIIIGPSDASKRPNQEYDYLLPGSGVLIWHVDERVAFGDFDRNGISNWEENALQWDEHHRFLDLEEADGIQDIGFTSQTERAEDLFYRGNTTIFGPATTPDSRSNSGADSHVTIRVESAPILVMRVAVDIRHTRAGWPVAVGTPISVQSPVLADVDRDRQAEAFIVAGDGRLYAWRADGSKLIPNGDVVRTVAFWGDTLVAPAAVFAEGAGSFFSAPAIADLDGDGAVEVITTDASSVYAWKPVDANLDGRADPKPGFPVRLIQPPATGQADRSVLTPPTVFRVDSGRFGIAVGTSSGGLIALRPDGTTLFAVTLSQTLNERLSVPPAAADVNGDGRDELIVALATPGAGRVAVVDATGHALWTRPAGLLGRASAPVVADLDGDGRFDVVVVGADGTVAAWDQSGSPLPGWPVDGKAEIIAPPAVGDLDGDGLPEVVVSGSNRVFAWHGNGAPVTNFPVVIDRANPVGLISSAPAIGDLDGDAIPEVVVGLPNGTVAAYHHDGRLAAGFPVGASGPVLSSPALGDLTGNGDIAVIVGADDGYVYLWTFRGNPDQLPWPMLAHDVRRTGAMAAPSHRTTPPGNLLAAASVYCYPNPVNGGSAGIRYRLGRSASIHIRIYTLTGEVVDEFEGPGNPGQNEIRWDVRGTASGVYLCRVEARDSAGGDAVFCKIAVVK